MRREARGQEGLMTVEAVLSLVPFIMVIVGIASFINIFAVHNKIQYALHQMGNELSGYTYFYQALGLRAADLELKGDIDAQTGELDQVLSDLGQFLDQIGELEGQDMISQGGQLAGSAGNLLSDPESLLRGFVYLGLEQAEGAAKSLLLDLISGGLMELYLDESFSDARPRTADQYLRSMGVQDGIDGLDFSKSELFQDENYRMIDMVVEYDVEVTILKLFLKDPTIHIVQRCAVPAWLDGDGVSYSGS